MMDDSVLKAQIIALEKDNIKIAERLNALEADNDMLKEARLALIDHIEDLETREAGWERSFREVVDDYAKLTDRLDALEEGTISDVALRRSVGATLVEEKPQSEWIHGKSGMAYSIDVIEESG